MTSTEELERLHAIWQTGSDDAAADASNDIMEPLHPLKQLPRETKRTQCADYDDDCYGIKDKVHCYLYDPTRGMCPFLSSHSKDVKDIP